MKSLKLSMTAALVGTSLIAPQGACAQVAGKFQPRRRESTSARPSADVFFAGGSAALPSDLPALAPLVAWLAGHPDARIVLESNAERSAAGDDLDCLAIHRVQAVRDHLLAKGVAAGQIVQILAGEGVPRRPLRVMRAPVTARLTDTPLHQLVDRALAESAAIIWQAPEA